MAQVLAIIGVDIDFHHVEGQAVLRLMGVIRPFFEDWGKLSARCTPALIDEIDCMRHRPPRAVKQDILGIEIDDSYSVLLGNCGLECLNFDTRIQLSSILSGPNQRMNPPPCLRHYRALPEVPCCGKPVTGTRFQP